MFDTRTESWAQYAERLDAYFIVNDVKENANRRAILQTVLESGTYALLRNLIRPATIPDKTYVELVAILSQHFNPKPSKIVERLHFNNRTRKQGESIAIYISELRKLSEHCCFGTTLDEMIRDRLVCGINDETMQRRLLAEEDTLTLAEAIRITQAMETATKNTHQIKNGENNLTSSANHVSSQQKDNENKARRKPFKKTNPSLPKTKFTPNANNCNRCTSTRHKSHECMFIKEKCYKCEKIGHIAKACQSTAVEKPKKRDETHQKSHYRANHIDQTTKISSEYEFPVYSVSIETEETDTEIPPPDIITCHINGQRVNFDVDNGSGHSMINEDDFRRVPHTGKIKKFTKTLRSYTGGSVNIIGSTTVTVKYKSREAHLPILVVQGQGPNLCGRKWLYSSLEMLPSINEARVNHVNQNQTKLEKILKNHEQLFTPGLGKLKNVQAHLHVKPDAVPKYCKARTVPYAMTEKVEAELQRMEKADIIESVPFSKYASPIVPVIKPNGNIRICGDFSSTVNPALNTEVYPLPRTQDIFARLAGCKHFSKIDLREAYNQIELDVESRELTVINTSKGLYRHKRLPFGISSSSAIFQRYMEMVTQGMIGVMPFQDDVLLGAKTEDEHLCQIDQVLSIMETNGLKLRKEKCHFFVSEIEFLGHRLNAKGLHPLNDKMEAIMLAPEPENVETLRSFLGMINYYGRFLPNHATTLAPLHKLLHKDTPWKWEREQKEAFQRAKVSMQTSKMLIHYDINKEVFLSCDASPYGIGGVISHMEKDSSGKPMERPITFISRSLTAAEKNYSQLEREALAIIFCVTKLRDYLYGKKFTLMTDHQPLTTLLAPNKPVPPMAAARIQRWALLLNAFQYEIKFRKGSANQNADALSRSPLPNTKNETPVPTEYVLLIKNIDKGPVTSDKLEKLTTLDPTLSKVLHYMRKGFPTTKMEGELEVYRRRQIELSNFDNVLFMGNRLIIPKACQEDFLKELHNTHQGIVQMKSLARSRIWWPNINQEIEEITKQCPICQENSSMPAAKFQSWPETKQPWHRVHADFAGPIEGKYLFIVVDSHSKWMEVDVTRSTSSEAVITSLRNHIARYGIMLTLVTDNGTCFTSQEFKNFVMTNGIKHLTTAPYHPQSNGQAERSVRTIKSRLKKLTGETTNELEVVNDGLEQFQSGSLETRLARILMSYRRTPLLSGKSPAELMIGRNIITRLDLCNPSLSTKSNMTQEQKPKAQPESSDVKRGQVTHKFAINDLVYVKNFGRGTKWRKGVIMKYLGKMMYETETQYGISRRHQNQIRLRIQAQNDNGQTQISSPDADIFNWMPNHNRGRSNPRTNTDSRHYRQDTKTNAHQSSRPDQHQSDSIPSTSAEQPNSGTLTDLVPKLVARPIRTCRNLKPAIYN